MTHENVRAVLISGGFHSVTTAQDDPDSGERFDPRNFERIPARDMPVSALSPGPHLRHGGLNTAHVQLLVDAASTAELPPVLVQQDGCRVIDGLHRVEAAKLRADDTIRARLLDCTDSEALVLGMEANRAHGLPLSKADRVAGAKRVLAAHPDWSDRALAGITGLSAKTIASLRDRSDDAAQSGRKRLGGDGRRRPVTAGDGRRRAAEYIKANPNATLRQIASETDVSLGTVHDVSSRLRRGAGPERDGNRAQSGPDAPPADATPLRRRNQEEPLTWPGVAANVASDPTIRYTESGKEFLRWMAMHASDPHRWREFVNAVPPHWLSVIAPIADSIGREWSLFAEQLKQTGSGAVGA